MTPNSKKEADKNNIPSPSSKPRPIRIIWDIKTPMRDGVLLSSDIYLPQKEGKYPVILQRTPYENSSKNAVQIGKFFAQHGYVFVWQDVRGRGDSEGIMDQYGEGQDGFDTIEWIAQQPWSNGKIGMQGGSYGGAVQWDAARELPPHLVTITPASIVSNLMEIVPFTKGIPNLEELQWEFMVSGKSNQQELLTAIDWEKVLFHLPLNTMDAQIGKKIPNWQEALEHPDLDELWKTRRLSERECSQIKIPMLHISGWHDDSIMGTLWAYEKLLKFTSNRDQQYLLIGPWNHGGTRCPKQKLRGIDYGTQSVLDMQEIHLKWFDYWLKGVHNEVATWKKTQVFMLGKNEWKQFDDHWPPSDNKSFEFYLSSEGTANSSKGTGRLLLLPDSVEKKDTFTYDPKNPVLNYVNFNMHGEDFEGSFEINYVTERDDVLVYTSEPVKNDIIIRGCPILEFHGSSDCVDTDWFATIAEVNNEGKAISFGAANFGTGCLRARYRESLSYSKLMVPNQIYKFSLLIDSLFVQIKKGHSIQVIFTSSAFPTFARNLNTGEKIGYGTDMKIAHNSLHHGGKYQSKLILPIKTQEK
ncbi:MAG: CocE/NonD family hydrolase [Promethearchaeota archaeon]